MKSSPFVVHAHNDCVPSSQDSHDGGQQDISENTVNTESDVIPNMRKT